MTQSRIKKKGKVSARQAVLPLNLRRQMKNPEATKLVFQLKSELNRLQLRDREWKMMFHMLSHDLKEPILTLEGFSKILSETELNKDQLRYVQVIREAVHTLHGLVGSLQSLAKMSQEHQEFSEVSLKELLQSVLASLASQIHRTKGTVLLPKQDAILKGDPIRLFQIFLNLIANSLKYHKKTELPFIEISYRKDSKFHRIAFKDNGVGISDKDLEKIFQPFTRLKEIPAEGLGIGLTIVKRIAESLRGIVVVRSRPGIGSTFTVCLPREVECHENHHR